VLLTLQVILQNFLILERLLANLANKFLHRNLFKLTSSQGFLLFLTISFGNLFPIFSEPFLIFQPLLFPFLLFLPSLLRLLSILLHLELLVSGVSLHKGINEFDDGLIELFPFLLPLFLVLCLYQSLDSTIWCSIWVVFIGIGKLFHCREIFPLVVKSENFFCC